MRINTSDIKDKILQFNQAQLAFFVLLLILLILIAIFSYSPLLNYIDGTIVTDLLRFYLLVLFILALLAFK